MGHTTQIYSRLKRSKNLPSLPQVLLQLIEICDREDVHLAEVSRVIRKDPSLSSTVLSLVNSAYFGLNNPFSNLDQAVVYLGADTIKNIAVTASVEQVFNSLKKNSRFPMERFWWNSLTTAVYAGRIARQVAYANVEEAYLAGLLHDIGELLLWMNFPQECAAVQDLISGKTDQCRIEEEQIGINHCEAGAWLIKQWKLNSFIADTALYHHALPKQVKGAFPLVKIVYLAGQCCLAGDGDFEAVYDTGYTLLGLGTEQISVIRTGVGDEVEEVAQSLGIPVEPPPEKPGEQEQTDHDVDLLQQVKNYSMLHGLLEDLVQADSRDAIVKAIEQAFYILFDVDVIFFFLYDFEKQTLQGCGSSVNPYRDHLASLELSAEEGTSLLVDSMLEKKMITLLRSPEQKMDSLADIQLLDAVTGRGMVYIPLHAKGRPVGVMVVGLPEASNNDVLSSSASRLVQLLAGQGAMSLYLDEVNKKQVREMYAARMAAASMAAARVVHEVNNPLSIIRNYLKIIEIKLPENDSWIKELAILDEEIRRISGIMQQLDDFATPMQHDFASTDLNESLSSFLKILSKSVLYSRNVSIHFTADPAIPPMVTDEGAVKQIIINLVKNAAEAMEGGGNVYIRTLMGNGNGCNDFLRITVHDDGPGLPESILSHLFEPFTSTKGKGHSGLGLSIVHNLVTELRGTVTCMSNKGESALFSITLPIYSGR